MSNPLYHAPAAPQQGYGISDMLAYFGLVVKLPLTFIRWSYREIAHMTLHSFAEGSCPDPQGAVPSPVMSDSETVLRKGHNLDVPDSTSSSLDSSRRTPTTPANFQWHPVGESQCNSTPDLTRQIVRHEIYPTLSGTYSDVWLSTWYYDKRKHYVAVKSLKIPFSNEDDKSKNCQKLMVKISRWAQLHHKNVLPLYGIAHDFGHFPSLVTPWMNEGSLNDYIANHHLSLRSKLDIAKQVVAGLGYLHAHSIVHGDISGFNILVDHQSRAQLSDFGVMLLLAEIPASAQPSGGVRSAIRWTDPQLFEVQKAEIDPCIPTEQTDIYSIGSVLLQLLTGSIPYYDIKDNIRVLVLSSTGVKPKCPPGTFVTSAQWSFIQRCWSPRGLSSRPTIEEIEEFLESELRMAGVP
ncbi:kinase-like domain-containing protein [Suillus subalutaceus]|uniref:kinase-like domain-containing protein n=1 Tax=Suillus subalutaceus TaxID=48586 RepID=UPI001B8636DC|nr:kinase-like domain-containing protein [Suillus subalutaceus]KAG1859312.1 kinase-like domain-containing protein [Suillus subalutaceus]